MTLYDRYIDLTLSHPATSLGGWYAKDRAGNFWHTRTVPAHPAPGLGIRIRQLEATRELPGLFGA